MYYTYTYSLDGTVFYVGKGKSRRCSAHLYIAFNKHDTRYESYFYRKLRKLTTEGRIDEVVIEKVKEFSEETEALAHEKLLIKRYGRQVDGGSLCNLTLGGEGTSGYTHTNETKRKIAESSKGRVHSQTTKDRIAVATKSQHDDPDSAINSEQTKAKLREASKGNTSALGHTHSPETRQKISEAVQQADKEGRGKRHHEVSAETRARMSEALKGNQCAKGYKRTDAEKEAIRQRTLGNQHWLGKQHSKESIDKMGTTAFAKLPSGVIQEYPSINAMREALGVKGLATLLRAIRSGKPISKGKLAGWVFYTELEDNRIEVPEEYRDLPRSRKEAKALGVERYYTGAPCKYEHRDARYVSGGCCTCRDNRPTK